jgi:hypothetical protein
LKPLRAIVAPRSATSDRNVDWRTLYVPGWTGMSPSWLAPPWP